MTEISQLSGLAALVANFEKLDSSILAAIRTGDLAVIEKTMEAKKKIKRTLTD